MRIEDLAQLLPRGVAIDVQVLTENTTAEGREVAQLIFAPDFKIDAGAFSNEADDEFVEYIEKVEEFLCREFPELQTTFKENTFLAQEYATEVLAAVATIYLFTFEYPVSETSLDLGDFDRAARFSAPQLLRTYLDALDYPLFLRSFLAKKLAKQVVTSDDVKKALAIIQELVEDKGHEITTPQQLDSFDDPTLNLLVGSKAAEFKPFFGSLEVAELVRLALLNDSELFVEAQTLLQQ